MSVRHEALNRWVAETAALCRPDKIVWMDGSERERSALEKCGVETGELTPLNPVLWPGCFHHRTATNDVARSEHLTFICTQDRADAGPTNNWMSPEEGRRRATEILSDAMAGRTMYVIPFAMGRLSSPRVKIGVQLTDSLYVAMSMRIMATVGAEVLDRLGADGAFTRCVHSQSDLRLDHRLILHFPKENAIWSVGSGYGGNAMLGKKGLALRIGSCLGLREGWLAEHMVIMGLEDPAGRVTWIAGAFPGACGKTSLAMLVPPEPFRRAGYRVWTVSDDIAWLHVDDAGCLRAVNPEAGIFGVAPGTNSRTNPNAVAALRRNTIFTNVLLTPDRSVWWEGADGPPPASGTDWRGLAWTPELRGADGMPVPGAHPNGRFTAPIAQAPSFLADAYNDPNGVKLSALFFGVRRERAVPLVAEARSWQHGVFLGATMASEVATAQAGPPGEVRRDPMAMLPFCGYHMADYFSHWLDIGHRLRNKPRIFEVNWFRKDRTGRFLWPGFADNFRVLQWMIRRCHDEVPALESPVGFLPRPRDLDLTGLELGSPSLRELFTVDRADWAAEVTGIRTFFARLGPRLPPELNDELRHLGDRLGLDPPAERFVVGHLGEARRPPSWI